MTENQMLAQAVRNRISDLQAAILRAEGERDGLAKVLHQLENSTVVAGQPPGGGAGGAERSAGLPAPAEDSGAERQPSGADGSDGEGTLGGTDGGVA